MNLPYQKGSNGPEILAWQEWAYRAYASYATLIGAKDSYYGNGEAAFTTEMQRRLGLPQTGVFDVQTAQRVNYKGVPPAPAYRKIWIYTAPGSGADWWLGPSFDLGERCKNVLHINHQPLAFTKGGYLGLMGGDPGFSYNEVTYDQYKSLEYNLDHNPDINDPDVELWFSGYSQSADGMEDALEILFGDGGFVIPATGEVCGPGKYRHLRDRINGVVQFGNPSKKDTGIARKVRPAWLDALIRNVFYDNDFYAVVPQADVIRPDFYAIIVESDISLPFFVHVLKIAVPVVLGYIPLLGVFGPLAQVAVAAMAGLSNLLPLFGGLMGQAGTSQDDAVDAKLEALLQPTGILENIPGLITLIAALPGLQAHGNYPFDPVMMDRSYDFIASFRR